MTSQYTSALLIMTILYLCSPSLALADRPKTDAAESLSVTVSWNAVDRDGLASAEGCTQCPIKLVIDHRTKFYLKGKKISGDMTELYSGQPGTVIYDVSDEHALKIVW